MDSNLRRYLAPCGKRELGREKSRKGEDSKVDVGAVGVQKKAVRKAQERETESVSAANSSD